MEKKLKTSLFTAIVLSLIFLSASSFSKGRNASFLSEPTWQIVESTAAKLSVDDRIKLNKALSAADLNPLRLRTARRILKFQDGLNVELLSATEMRKMGMTIDPSSVPEKVPFGYKEPVYSLSSDGHLLQLFEAQENKAQ